MASKIFRLAKSVSNLIFKTNVNPPTVNPTPTTNLNLPQVRNGELEKFQLNVKSTKKKAEESNSFDGYWVMEKLEDFYRWKNVNKHENPLRFEDWLERRALETRERKTQRAKQSAMYNREKLGKRMMRSKSLSVKPRKNQENLYGKENSTNLAQSEVIFNSESDRKVPIDNPEKEDSQRSSEDIQRIENITSKEEEISDDKGSTDESNRPESTLLETNGDCQTPSGVEQVEVKEVRLPKDEVRSEESSVKEIELVPTSVVAKKKIRRQSQI